MIAEIVGFVCSLLQYYTEILIERALGSTRSREAELEPLIKRQHDSIQEFTAFDPDDHVFQEFDPPEMYKTVPKAWKMSLPSWKRTFADCFKTVLLIQTLSGSLIGLISIGFVIVHFSSAEWCSNMVDQWDHIPKKVQNLRVTVKAIEGAIGEMWNFACIVSIFPLSLIKDLHLLASNIFVAFADAMFRLYLQMIGSYDVSWRVFILNALFLSAIVFNNHRLAHKFYPSSWKRTVKLNCILSAPFLLGIPATLLAVYVLFPWFFKQDEHIKFIIASLSPLLTAIPKVVIRLSAQTLNGIIHPGTAFVLATSPYAASSILFRVMQSDINTLGLFVGLGIAHGAVDLVERITVTMRDQIWEYLYRLICRGKRPGRRYVTRRSRRFVAELTIQIMLLEATTLVISVGVMSVYPMLYNNDKQRTGLIHVITNFFKRVGFGLIIDLAFNTVSLFIQTRLMNIAVCRVWKTKWRYHVAVNAIIVLMTLSCFNPYLFEVVQNKYGNIIRNQNCTYPDFL